MINAEKYKKEILEAMNSKNKLSLEEPVGFSMDKYSNKIEPCSEDAYSKCENCLFDDEDLTHRCGYHRTKWLLAEYGEPIKLSRLEYEILKLAINKSCEYIARDSDGQLFVFMEKPHKGESFWKTDGYYYLLEMFSVLFQFVKWKDSTPTPIKEVLKNCVVEEEQ